MSIRVLSGTVLNDNCHSFFPFFNIIFLLNLVAHAVNLGNMDVMGHITKIIAVENAMTIWEYDPTRADNCVLGTQSQIFS